MASVHVVKSPNMLADYFTKPLQGATFRHFRSVIMGWEPISTLFTKSSDSVESKDLFLGGGKLFFILLIILIYLTVWSCHGGLLAGGMGC